MAESYSFFAFISWSYKDIAATVRFQKKIITYIVPTSIRNEIKQKLGVECPRRIGPIILDAVDLQVGVWENPLLCHLENSKYLIVICSPNSAVSKWVNREVEDFILMGRYERIIPYIIDGEANAQDPSKEAFPPILRRQRELLNYDDLSPEENAERQQALSKILADQGELRGFSAELDGKRNAWLKVIARLLVICPDELILQDRRRIKRRQLIAAACVCALIIAVFIGLFIIKQILPV